MDKLSFKWEKVKYEIDDKSTRTWQIFINGTSLVDMVKKAELPMATANNEASIAGSYAPLTLEDLYDEINVDMDGKNKKITLLGCPCGIVDCWPLQAHLEENENSIIWYGFSNPHRKWDYSKFGPFVFDKKEYKNILEELKRNINL